MGRRGEYRFVKHVFPASREFLLGDNLRSTTCGSARPLLATHTASPVRSDSELPIGTLRPESGIIGLINASPVRKSLPTTNPGTARPSWEPIQISSASLIT